MARLAIRKVLLVTMIMTVAVCGHGANGPPRSHLAAPTLASQVTPFRVCSVELRGRDPVRPPSDVLLQTPPSQHRRWGPDSPWPGRWTANPDIATAWFRDRRDSIDGKGGGTGGLHFNQEDPCLIHDTGLASTPSGSMSRQAQCVRACGSGGVTTDDDGTPTPIVFGRAAPLSPSHRGVPVHKGPPWSGGGEGWPGLR